MVENPPMLTLMQQSTSVSKSSTDILEQDKGS